MINKIIGILHFTDDILKAIGEQDDCRLWMTDAEVLNPAESRSFVLYQNSTCFQLKLSQIQAKYKAILD